MSQQREFDESDYDLSGAREFEREELLGMASYESARENPLIYRCIRIWKNGVDRDGELDGLSDEELRDLPRVDAERYARMASRERFMQNIEVQQPLGSIYLRTVAEEYLADIPWMKIPEEKRRAALAKVRKDITDPLPWRSQSHIMLEPFRVLMDVEALSENLTTMEDFGPFPGRRYLKIIDGELHLAVAVNLHTPKPRIKQAMAEWVDRLEIENLLATISTGKGRGNTYLKWLNGLAVMRMRHVKPPNEVGLFFRLDSSKVVDACHVARAAFRYLWPQRPVEMRCESTYTSRIKGG